jgi:hypothetical protein
MEYRMLAWVRNLNDGASEVGSGPVGAGPGRYSLKLVGIGRLVTLWWGLAALARFLLPRG